jgi:ABC-type transporter Mla subunit MlaD
MAEITIRISDKILKGVGVIVLVFGSAALGLHIWNSDLLVAAYHLNMYVPELEGLTRGEQVRLNGMPVGKVVSIKPVPAQAGSTRRVQIVLRVPKRYQDYIRTDSTASINAQGLLGKHFVDIQGANGGTPIQPGGEIVFQPTPEVTPKDFIDALGNIGKRNGCSDSEKHEPTNRHATN